LAVDLYAVIMGGFLWQLVGF